MLKELQENFHTVRFYLIITLTFILFASSSLIFIKEYRQKIEDYRNDVIENNSQLERASSRLYSLGKYNQTLIKKPNPLELISEANEKFLPSTIRTNIFHLDFPQVEGRANALLREYRNIDWTFIVGVVLSFLAFVLSYDAVCGEKQQKTLSLVFSNSVKTSQVYLGKILGLFFTLAIPFLTAVVFGLVILGIGGRLFLDFGQVGLFVLCSLVFLFLFILIGVTISSIFTRTIISAITLLFIWVITAFVIPASGNLIAPQLTSLPKKSEVLAEIRRTSDDIYQTKYADTDAGHWNGDHFASWVPLRAQWMEDVANARDDIYEDYIQKMVNQVEKTKDITRISPVCVYQYLVEDISGTGIDRFKSFYRQVKQYKQRMYQFVQEKDKQDPDSNHYLFLALGIYSGISFKPVVISSVPRFEEELPSIKDNGQSIIFDFSLLIILCVLLFYVGYVLFIRYDKR